MQGRCGQVAGRGEGGGQGAEHQGGQRLEVLFPSLQLCLCQAWLSEKSHFASKLIHGPGVLVLPEQLSVNNYSLQGPSIRFRG